MVVSILLFLSFLVNGARADLIDDLKSEKVWVQNGCDIYTTSRTVKKFPGKMCIFLNDGSFISASEMFIRKFSPKNTIVWQIPGMFHHQINLSHDKTSILALSSEVAVVSGRAERNDVFLKIDLDGKILARRSAMDLLKSQNLFPLYWDNEKILEIVKAKVETSHFNSIYEVPGNKNAEKAAFLKPGSVIVNSLSLGIFILSPDFNEVLYKKTFSFSHNHTVHDVQVNPEGEFLLYNNDNLIDSKDRVYHSAIQKYDPLKDVVTFEYTAKEKELFFSPSCGGVQKYDDYIFFSQMMTGGLLYSLSKKKIVMGIPGVPHDPTEFSPTQQLKLIDPRDFFRNSSH